MREYCPNCKEVRYALYAAGSWVCSECGANITYINKAANAKLAREINAAVKAGKTLTAWRHFPKSPSRRDVIDKASGGDAGVRVRWLDSHKWQFVTREQVSGI